MKARRYIVLVKTTEGKLLFYPLGYHKFLLAAFGFLLDDMRGLIIGLSVGCVFDMKFERKIAPPKHADLRLNFLMLAAFILQVTGLDVAIPKQTIQSRLNKEFGESYIEKRMHFFGELMRQRIQVEAICEQLKAQASLDEKINLVRFLYEISSHPRLQTEKLNQTLFYLANRIDLDSKYIKQLSAQHAQKSRSQQNVTEQELKYRDADPYSVFGLPHDCSERDLKKAYHHLAKQYHPDAHPGISPSEKIAMQEKFRRITELYEELKLQRGWK